MAIAQSIVGIKRIYPDISSNQAMPLVKRSMIALKVVMDQLDKEGEFDKIYKEYE